MPRPTASGTPKTSRRRATSRRNPKRTGTRAIRRTSTQTTSDWVIAPRTKLRAPAPFAASVTRTAALKTNPMAIAIISLSCMNWRWITPTETDVTPSTMIVRLISRTSSVASGLCARSAMNGAAAKNRAYQPRLNAIAIVRAVAAISLTSPRHWTVAAIMPMSLTWMRKALAANATA